MKKFMMFIPYNYGGESGIRTHGTFDSTQAFQAGADNFAAIFILITFDQNFFLYFYIRKNISFNYLCKKVLKLLLLQTLS